VERLGQERAQEVGAISGSWTGSSAAGGGHGVEVERGPRARDLGEGGGVAGARVGVEQAAAARGGGGQRRGADRELAGAGRLAAEEGRDRGDVGQALLAAAEQAGAGVALDAGGGDPLGGERAQGGEDGDPSGGRRSRGGGRAPAA
jgi:hypothetical protein